MGYRHLFMIGLALAPLASATAQAPAPTEEIVVTARRTGAPVWRITSGSGTLVVVGAISEVVEGTPYRPEALALTVQRADRVMFPEGMEVQVKPLAMFGYLAKWKRMGKLPKGQTIRGFVSPGDFARLAALARARKAPANFETMHPAHLALEMRSDLRRDTRMMRDASEIVSRTALKHKVPRVPIRTLKARPVADVLFNSRPSQHVPCLRAAIRMVEEGPAALRARSHDWANKRIPPVLASASAQADRVCFPSGFIDGPSVEDITATARRALGGSGTTLAVLSLDSVAQRGGVLDRLKAAGYRIDGPEWH